LRTTDNKTETQKIIALAIPSIITQLAQTGLNVIDNVMAGHYSAEALAAIAIGSNLYTPVIVFAIGIILVLNPMIAQLNGKGAYGEIRSLFQNGVFLSLLLVLPSFLLLRNFEPVLYQLDIDSRLIPVTQGYMDALSWGLPGLYLFFALRFANEGLFTNKIIMLIAVAALPLNVLLNYLFIYGGLGIPSMGPVGVGWATATVNYFMFGALLLFTARAHRFKHIAFFSHWQKPDFKVLKDLLKVGVPMGMSIGLEVALFALVGLMIGSYSIAEIAGHQIAINIASLSYMMPFGLSIAITARVGYHIGSNKPLMAKSSGYLGIIMSLAIMVVNAALLVAFPAVFASLYSSDSAVVAVTTQLLFFAALFQLSDGIQMASTGALRGLKDTKIPMYISAFAYWAIGFSTGYYTAEVLEYGVKGYWVGLICGLSVAAILLTARFFKLINRMTKNHLEGRNC
jgi:MATE family multidrug resistance protein